MYKVIWLVKFRKDMSREDALRHWRDVHGPLGLRVPGIERYIQNPWVEPLGENTVVDGELAFDGHSECWFKNKAGFEAAMASPEWAEMVADAPNFFDSQTMVGAVLDECVVRA